MTKRHHISLLSKVERRLRDAEVDHAWSLHESADAQQLARSTGRLAALRYAQERLLDEVAIEGFLAELAELCALAISAFDHDPQRLPSLLAVGEELFCTYRVGRFAGDQRN